MAKRIYYSLIVRDTGRQPNEWGVEFGDWDKAVVKAEADDLHESHVKRKDMVIVETDGRQASIDAIVAVMNAKVAS